MDEFINWLKFQFHIHKWEDIKQVDFKYKETDLHHTNQF